MILLEKDKISVIIPTFNRAKLITRSVKSVLNQTYENIEIIVVDDGGSDNTKEVLSKIKDNRLKYYRLRKNSGTGAARNYGISKATGNYIAFQDSDDLFLKNKLEFQMNNMKKNKSDMDFCRIKIYDKKSDFLIPTDDDELVIRNKGILEKLCYGNVVSTQAILIKRDVLDDVKFDHDIPNTDDYDLALRVAIKYKVSYTNEVLVELYRQNDSISFSDEKLKKSCATMLKKHYDLKPELEDILVRHLAFEYGRMEIAKYNYENNLLQEKISKMNEDNKKLVDENKTLYNELSIVNKNYEKLYDDYNKVINSKRYKIVNNILDKPKKIFGGKK